MFLRRILFQLSLVTVILCAAYVGISGAEAIAVDIFGEEYFEGPSTIFSPRLWFGIPFMVVCCSISSFGALFCLSSRLLPGFPKSVGCLNRYISHLRELQRFYVGIVLLWKNRRTRRREVPKKAVKLTQITSRFCVFAALIFAQNCSVIWVGYISARFLND